MQQILNFIPSTVLLFDKMISKYVIHVISIILSNHSQLFVYMVTYFHARKVDNFKLNSMFAHFYSQ